MPDLMGKELNRSSSGEVGPASSSILDTTARACKCWMSPATYAGLSPGSEPE